MKEEEGKQASESVSMPLLGEQSDEYGDDEEGGGEDEMLQMG